MNPLSLRIIVLLLGIALEVSAAEYRILSGCEDSAEVRANISKDAEIEIHFSIAGSGSSTCYSVTATLDGKRVRGYVLNANLDAVRAFEQSRIKNTQEEIHDALPVVRQPSVPIADLGVNSTDAKKSVDAEPRGKQVPKVKAPVEPPR